MSTEKPPSRFLRYATIFGLALSFMGLVGNFSWDILRNKKIQKHWHINLALTHRPRLHICSVDSVYLSGKFSKKEALNALTSISATDDTVKARLDMRLKVRITNVSDFPAKPLLVIAGAHISGLEELRRYLIEDDIPVDTTTLVTPFYAETEIGLGDTMDIHFDLQVPGVNDSTFVVHILVLYENEAGILYDTYYWQRFVSRPVLCRMTYIPIPCGIVRKLQFERNSMRNAVTVLDSNEISDYYGQKTTKIVRRKLSRLAN